MDTNRKTIIPYRKRLKERFIPPTEKIIYKERKTTLWDKALVVATVISSLAAFGTGIFVWKSSKTNVEATKYAQKSGKLYEEINNIDILSKRPYIGILKDIQLQHSDPDSYKLVIYIKNIGVRAAQDIYLEYYLDDSSLLENDQPQIGFRSFNELSPGLDILYRSGQAFRFDMRKPKYLIVRIIYKDSIIEQNYIHKYYFKFENEKVGFEIASISESKKINDWFEIISKDTLYSKYIHKFE